MNTVFLAFFPVRIKIPTSAGYLDVLLPHCYLEQDLFLSLEKDDVESPANAIRPSIVIVGSMNSLSIG